MGTPAAGAPQCGSELGCHVTTKGVRVSDPSDEQCDGLGPAMKRVNPRARVTSFSRHFDLRTITSFLSSKGAAVLVFEMLAMVQVVINSTITFLPLATP